MPPARAKGRNLAFVVSVFTLSLTCRGDIITSRMPPWNFDTVSAKEGTLKPTTANAISIETVRFIEHLSFLTPLFGQPAKRGYSFRGL